MARKSTGHLFQRKEGGTWYLKYTVNGKRVTEALYDDDENPIVDPDLAEARRNEIMAPIVYGDRESGLKSIRHRLSDATDKVEKHPPRVKLTKLDDAWTTFERHELRDNSERTKKDYRDRWKRFTSWYKDEHMDKITVANARAFSLYLTEKLNLSPNRHNKIIQFCRRLWRYTFPGKEDPFASVKTHGQNTVSRRELSEGELKDVIENSSGELRTLLAIGLYTGLRLSDAVTLQWDEVSFELNRITRMPRKTRRKQKTVVIPLHPVLRMILEATPIEQRRGDVTPELAAKYRHDDTSLSRHVIQKHFKACGITTTEKSDSAKKRSKVGFHSLRHSFVTMCAKNGVPLAIVQELCGHGSPAIQRVYLHMGDDETNAAIMSLPNLIDAPAAKSAKDILQDALKLRSINGLKKAIKEAITKL